MLRDAATILIVRIAGAALWLIYAIVIARLLSPADFGLVFYCINAVIVATPLITLGFEVATMRLTPRYWTSGRLGLFKSILTHGKQVVFFGGAALAIALSVTIPLVPNLLEENTTNVVIFLAFLSLIANALVSINSNALRGASKVFEAVIGLTLIRTTLAMGGAIGLAFLGGLSAISALALFLIGLLCALVQQEFSLARITRGAVAERGMAWQHFNTALLMWPGEVSGMFLTRVGGLMVGIGAGLEAAALYLAAERISTLGQFIGDAIDQAATPKFSTSFEGRKEPGRDDLLAREVSRASTFLLISGLGSGLAVLLIGWPVLWLFGPEFTAAYPVLAALMIAQVTSAMLGPASTILSMTNLAHARTVIMTVSAGVATITTWLGAVIAGPLGGALAISLTVTTMNIFLFSYASRRLSLRIGIFSLSPAIFLETVFTIRRGISASYLKMRTLRHEGAGDVHGD